MAAGIVGTLADAAMGLDVTTPLNPISARQYLNQGYRFVIRYVGRGDDSKKFVDLNLHEAEAIVDSELALGVVQHPLAEGWHPNGPPGREFGAAAASLTGAAGIPIGVNVWLDLEGVAGYTQARDVLDYSNAWFKEASAVGLVPGIYIGANRGISADQLYWDLQVKSYWRGGSSASFGVPVDIPIAAISSPSGSPAREAPTSIAI